MSDERGRVGDDSPEEESGTDMPPGGGGYTGPTGAAGEAQEDEGKGGAIDAPPGGGGYTGPRKSSN